MSYDNNNEDESILTTKKIEETEYGPMLERERCYECKKCMSKYCPESNKYEINSSYIFFMLQNILYLIIAILTRFIPSKDNNDLNSNSTKSLTIDLGICTFFCSIFFLAESVNEDYSSCFSCCCLIIVFISIFIFKGLLYILGYVLIKFYFKDEDGRFIVIASLSFVIFYYTIIIQYNVAIKEPNLCMILLFGLVFGIIAILIACSILGFEEFKYLSAIIALQIFFINLGYCFFIKKEKIPDKFLLKTVTLDLYKFKIIFWPISRIIILYTFICDLSEYLLNYICCCGQ